MTFVMTRGDRTLPNSCGGSAAPGKLMFIEKIAQSTQMSYSDGDTKKAQWVKTVRNYLIGRSWEMRQLLPWAKSFQKQVITFMDFQNLGIANTYMEDMGSSPMRASSELWAVLNLNVTGHGRNKFDAARELNGLDVWRRIVVPLAPKTFARRVEMYSALHSPAKCKHIGEMTDHLEAWERTIDDLILMGGQRLNDSESFIIALNMLPADTLAFFVHALQGHQDYSNLKMLLD